MNLITEILMTHIHLNWVWNLIEKLDQKRSKKIARNYNDKF